MKRAKDQFSCFYFFTTSVFDENDIPESVLDMNKLSSYRVDELKFWLSCRGDSLKNLSTKAACIQRYISKKRFSVQDHQSIVLTPSCDVLMSSPFVARNSLDSFFFLHCLE